MFIKNEAKSTSSVGYVKWERVNFSQFESSEEKFSILKQLLQLMSKHTLKKLECKAFAIFKGCGDVS